MRHRCFLPAKSVLDQTEGMGSEVLRGSEGALPEVQGGVPGGGPWEVSLEAGGESVLSLGGITGGTYCFSRREGQEVCPNFTAGEVEAGGSGPPLRSGALRWAPACLPACLPYRSSSFHPAAQDPPTACLLGFVLVLPELPPAYKGLFLGLGPGRGQRPWLRSWCFGTWALGDPQGLSCPEPAIETPQLGLGS